MIVRKEISERAISVRATSSVNGERVAIINLLENICDMFPFYSIRRVLSKHLSIFGIPQ